MIGPAETCQTDLSLQAWKTLEDRLRPFIARRVSRQADVDDILQDVFVRVLRGLPTLRNRERFGPWVYQIARSTIIDHYRASGRAPRLVDDIEARMDAETDRETDENPVASEVAEYARIFLDLLPSPYREALTLTELEGLTQKEAAEQLGISHSGMKSRVQRGREKLRAELEQCCKITLDARQRVTECEARNPTIPHGCCS